MKSRIRHKIFIDRPVQGSLVLRVLLYWTFFVTGIYILLAGIPIVLSLFVPSAGTPSAWQIMAHTGRVFWPGLFASALLLPLLILDVIRVSNRFAGPVYRLKGALRDLADGTNVEPIKFREGDFWSNVAEEFNRVAGRMRELQNAATQGTAARKTDAKPAQPPSHIAV